MKKACTCILVYYMYFSILHTHVDCTTYTCENHTHKRNNHTNLVICLYNISLISKESKDK